jgi:penicillin-binding protein 1A
MAVPSLALGSSAVTPLELTSAYVPFANGGEGVMPYGIAEIRTSRGRLIWSRQSSGEGRVMSAQDAGEVNQLMVAVMSGGTGKAARLSERPSAGKTGTTQDFHDAWFVGFTADLVTGVWIGNDDNAPMVHATGGGLPAHIFHAYMEDAEAGRSVKPLPALAAMPAVVAAATAPAATAQTAAADQPAPAPADDGKKPSAFDDIVNSLFGAKASDGH